METKLKIVDLYKSFGAHKVLEGINLEVPNGSSMVILGGSGSGKSVLIKTIIGLMSADSGKIYIDKQETTNISTKERFILMEKCGFLFQSGALFDSLNILDNITFFAERIYKLTKDEKKDLAIKKLRSVGLKEDFLTYYPSELSGGMQKRVSLARAICTNPEIIFFDEPTTGLDPIMANVINDLIIQAREELGATTVTITHDMNSAYRIASNVSMIYKGKILWNGTKEDLNHNDNPYLKQFIEGSTEGPISAL